MTFPKEHRVKLHSTNPSERSNGESGRKIEVVGMEAASETNDTRWAAIHFGSAGAPLGLRPALSLAGKANLPIAWRLLERFMF